LPVPENTKPKVTFSLDFGASTVARPGTVEFKLDEITCSMMWNRTNGEDGLFIKIGDLTLDRKPSAEERSIDELTAGLFWIRLFLKSAIEHRCQKMTPTSFLDDNNEVAWVEPSKKDITFEYPLTTDQYQVILTLIEYASHQRQPGPRVVTIAN